jgi:hypothetical protein
MDFGLSFAKTGVVQRLAESDLLMASAEMKVGNRAHPAFAFRHGSHAARMCRLREPC